MAQNVKRALAAIAALLGLALTIGGLWVAVRVGPSGTATFTGKPTTSGAVVLPSNVLNRLDADVTVTAEPVPDGSAWIGVASPSDAEAVLGTSPKITAVAFDKSEFSLRLEPSGQGEAPALTTADIWRTTASAKGSTSVTLRQADAPESVVITTDKQRLASVTVTMARKAWFVQAMVGLLTGLALLVGALLLWRSARHTAQPGRRAKGAPTAYPYGKGADTATETTLDAATEEQR